MRALDTTFLIDLARGDPAAGRRAKEWSAENERLIVPAPAAAELALGGHVRGGRIESRTMELLSELEIVSLEPRDALEAGRMGAELRKRGRSVDMLDLLIAATAQRYSSILVTRDQALLGLPGVAAESY